MARGHVKEKLLRRSSKEEEGMDRENVEVFWWGPNIVPLSSMQGESQETEPYVLCVFIIDHRHPSKNHVLMLPYYFFIRYFTGHSHVNQCRTLVDIVTTSKEEEVIKAKKIGNTALIKDLLRERESILQAMKTSSDSDSIFVKDKASSSAKSGKSTKSRSGKWGELLDMTFL